jgi:hypothetical protein
LFQIFTTLNKLLGQNKLLFLIAKIKAINVELDLIKSEIGTNSMAI